MKLVCDEDLERVEDRIDPSYPAEPVVHIRNGDDETRVHDDGENEDTRESHSLRDRLCKSRHGSESSRHGEHCDEVDEEEKEEWSGFASKSCEEVQGDIETYREDELQPVIGSVLGQARLRSLINVSRE